MFYISVYLDNLGKTQHNLSRMNSWKTSVDIAGHDELDGIMVLLTQKIWYWGMSLDDIEDNVWTVFITVCNAVFY